MKWLKPGGMWVLMCLGSAIAVGQESTPIKYADVNDIRLAYLDEGSGPLVVLIHGFPDTPATWDHLRPQLVAAGYRVVTPWTRGYAPSGIPTERVITSETMGRDVVGLISALGETSAIVVGHDWGASAAYAAATLAPEVVTHLVTVAIPHPGTIDPTVGQLWKGRHFVYLSGRRGVKILSKDNFAHVDELYARWAPSWEVPAAEVEAVKTSFSQPGSADAALGYYRGARKPEPLFEQKISVPTLAVCGADDAFTPDDFARAATAFTGTYSVVVIPGEHWPHHQSVEAFDRAVMEFLKPPVH